MKSLSICSLLRYTQVKSRSAGQGILLLRPFVLTSRFKDVGLRSRRCLCLETVALKPNSVLNEQNSLEYLTTVCADDVKSGSYNVNEKVIKFSQSQTFKTRPSFSFNLNFPFPSPVLVQRSSLPGIEIYRTKSTVSKSEITEGTASADKNMSVPLHNESPSPYVVGHDSSKNIFYIKLREPSSEEATATLYYSHVRSGVVDMYETFVPEEFRGHGIGNILAKAAFDYFSEQEILMRPTCTFLQKYYRENPLPSYREFVDREFA